MIFQRSVQSVFAHYALSPARFHRHRQHRFHSALKLSTNCETVCAAGGGKASASHVRPTETQSVIHIPPCSVLFSGVVVELSVYVRRIIVVHYARGSTR